MVHVLSSRVLLRPTDPAASRDFYGRVLGLAVQREFETGPGPEDLGTVYFLGGGHLELSGRAEQPANPGLRLWLQVLDVEAAHRELRERGARITRPPVREPWGLVEMWVAAPDEVSLCVVEIPADHPLRYRPAP
ncbi:VOC family protein [Streptomyces sp. XM4193]|uniref:VOC family protein n=1 Tax=Streptomyces sp. XM4193 TaxID=2929782 RepID=UPI001FFA40AF|nr:VOC family protein [Streptomyces sp. XM4193]MCK1797741.1 VOC family protein [Streptomyces sp. XM4193]